jgi:MFS family permease
MRANLDLLRNEPRARLFFLAHAQSSFGNGAAYVALLLLAYERLHSPWAVALVLLADFIPSMALGPVLGACADRFPRRACAVLADVLRAAAFLGLALFGSFWLTLALALMAGVGTGLFEPAVQAGLPSLVRERRLPAAMALFGSIAELGYTAGPIAAAGVLLVVEPSALMAVNGVTFAVSALILARLPFGGRAAPASEGSAGAPAQVAAVAEPVAAPTRAFAALRSLLADTRAGLAAALQRGPVRTVLLSSTAFVVFLGMVNVGELLLAKETLDAGAAGFSALVAVMGLGIAVGSLAGAAGGAPEVLRRRYLAGLGAIGAGFLGAAAAPGLAPALAAFAVLGFGNGWALVHERTLLQMLVPDALKGRVFGVKGTLVSWAFALAFVSAGAITSAVGPRGLFLLAAVGALAVAASAALTLRRQGLAVVAPQGAAPAPQAPVLVPGALEPAGAARAG